MIANHGNEGGGSGGAQGAPKSVSERDEGTKSMGFIGLADRVYAARSDAEEAQERYAREGTAIDRAKQLPGTEEGKRQSGDLRITNYGYRGDNVRGDPNTPKGIGVGNRILTQNTVALSRDLAKQFHLDKGIYVNGHYIGNYKDTTSPKSVRTIDVYDPRGGGPWRVFSPPGTRVTEGRALMDY